tara:strand:- start:252 stop:971 length:720 start_codon:yes stop_codon:yes gene_type:complete
MEIKNNFWDDQIEEGYYEKVLSQGLERKTGIQSNWHNITFLKIKKHLSSDIKHLDYACGPGSLIGLYSESKSLGYDISDKQIKYAKKRFSSNTKVFTTEREEILRNGKYDLITICGLFEFLKNQEILELMNELRQLLKQGGKIIITTPNYRGIFPFIEKIGEIIGEVEYRQVNINKFNITKLEKILQEGEFTNFKVQKFLNVGVFASLFGHKIGIKLESLIGKVFNNFFGLLLYAEVEF